jgi:hypothetical protein
MLIKLLDRLPLWLLLTISIMAGFAPFNAEPHLLEKLKMLVEGTLHRPIDILDLLIHGTPALICILKIVRITYIYSSQNGKP